MKTPDEYRRRKEQARAAAIEWQRTFGDTSHSWGEVAEQAAKFERLGRRYGLLREFRENGVL